MEDIKRRHNEMVTRSTMQLDTACQVTLTKALDVLQSKKSKMLMRLRTRTQNDLAMSKKQFQEVIQTRMKYSKNIQHV